MHSRLLPVFAAPLLLAAGPPADAVKKEWAALEGTWVVTKLELAGKSLLESGKPGPKIVIKDGKVKAQDASVARPTDIAPLTLDPGKKPRTLTSTVEGGLLTLLGIYALDGDELKVCTVVVETARAKEREKERPREFDSGKGILLVFKRVKP